MTYASERSRFGRSRATVMGLTSITLLMWSAPATASVFGLVDTGELFVSNDEGETWTVRSALPVSDAIGLVAGVSSSDLYLASETGTIYTSTDAGLNWSATSAVTATDVVAIHIRPDGALMVLTRSGTVFGSPDAATFSVVSTITASNMVSLSRRPGPIYALAETGEVSRSDDDAASWTTVGAFTASDAVEVVSLAEDVYAITSTGDVWTSTDGGATWNAVSTLSQVHTSSLTRTIFGGVFYACTREGEVARSSDGVNWTWVGATGQLNVVALATDDAIVEVPATAPQVVPLRVSVARPNPLRSSRRVGFDVETVSGGRLGLGVYDAVGRRVGHEVQSIESGATRILAETSGLAAGVYFVHITIGNESASQRFVIAR